MKQVQILRLAHALLSVDQHGRRLRRAPAPRAVARLAETLAQEFGG